MATTTVFGSPTAIGAKILTISTTITNTSGEYTNTIQDDRLTASMKAIKLELGNPAAFDAVINVVVNNGYLTINCASVTGTSTAIISIIKVTEDPTAITSTEFDILANRISHMTTLFEVTLDSVTNTSGSYTHTTTVAGMTSDLKCVKLECSDPTIFRDTVDITSGSDSVTLTCSNVTGSSTVKASFLSVGNGNPLSSMEYSALDTRIGALSDLDTTDKTNIVSAINEVDGSVSRIGAMFEGNNGTTSLNVSSSVAANISALTLTKGTYLIVGTANWAVNGTGYRQIAFNSAVNPGRLIGDTTVGLSGKETYQQIVYIKNITSDSEQILLYAYQNSGSTIQVWPYLYAIRIK